VASKRNQVKASASIASTSTNLFCKWFDLIAHTCYLFVTPLLLTKTEVTCYEHHHPKEETRRWKRVLVFGYLSSRTAALRVFESLSHQR